MRSLGCKKKRAAVGGNRGSNSPTLGEFDRVGGTRSIRVLMSGVEEGGGEPSSGSTPDKKSPDHFSAAEPSWLFMRRPASSTSITTTNLSHVRIACKIKLTIFYVQRSRL